MSAAFGWSPVVVGQLQSAFFWGFMAMQLPAGAAASKFSGRRTLAVGVALWSLGTLFTPITAMGGAAWFPLLFASRIFVGLGQGCAPTSFADLIGKWVPVTERSRAVGLVFSGFNVGNMFGLICTPVLIKLLGWQSAFYTFGLAGVVWLLAWQLVPLPLNPAGTADAQAAAESGVARSAAPEEEPTVKRIPWGNFLRYPSTWALIVAHWSDNWGKFALLSWMPMYFNSRFDLPLASSAFIAVLPPLAGIVVAGFATTWADKQIAAGDPITMVRKIAMVIALVAPAACLVGTIFAPNFIVAAVSLTTALGLARFALASLYCVHSDMSPKYASTLLGITNTAGAAAGIVSTSLTGTLLKATDSWALSLFVPAIGMYLIGAVVFSAFVNAELYDFDHNKPVEAMA